VTLKIYLLGQFKLAHGEQPLDLPSRPAQSLLAYLALNPGLTHRREKLAGLLWPDSTEENARNYLRQAFWRIHKAIESGSLEWEAYLDINKISASFLPDSDHWLDAQQLLQKDTDPEDLPAILSLYQGELLPGFYDNWISVERDRLLAAYHEKARLLIDSLLASEDWNQVLEWSEHWLRHGNAPESAFQALMRAHAGLGDRARVITTLKRCKDALQREVGVDPSTETMDLFERLTDKTQAISIPKDSRKADRIPQRPAFLDDFPQPELEQIPFVAREAELDQLQFHLQDMLSGRGKVVFVTGEAGSGKTSLLQEFTRYALKTYPELVVAGGNCNAHTGLGDPYLPLREILGQLTGDVEARLQAGAMTLEHAQRLWDNLVQTIPIVLDLGPDLIETLLPGKPLLRRATLCVEAQTDWLTHLEDFVSRKATGSMLPGPQQNDLIDQYNRVIKGIAQTSPLVLIIDDLQWADAGSIGMLFHLGRHLGGSSILIIGSYRMEDVSAGREGERHPLVPLINEFQRLYGQSTINLGQSDRRYFIDALLDCEPNRLEASFRDMLYRHTQGHPLFTIELLRGMQERGDLVQDHGVWVEGSALEWEMVPARVEAVIAERVGRLTPLLQSVLRVASVEGEIFTNEVVARVLEEDERQLLPALSGELDKKHRLIRADSIQRINGQVLSNYRFRNILFQKFLYSNLDQVERVHIHERIATILETLCTELQEYPEIVLQLARHFEEAGITKKAIQYLHQAGDRAISITALKEGLAHLVKSLELLDRLPLTEEREAKELEIQLSIGKAWKYQGPTEVARHAINRARELCTKLGRIEQLARVLGELSIFYYVIADYHQATQFAKESLTLAEQAEDPMLKAEGHWLMGFQKICLAEYADARSHLQEVSTFYKPSEHHQRFIDLRGVDAGLSALAYESVCLQVMGFPDQAKQKSTEAINLAKAFDHSFTLSDVLCFGGCMFHEMRNEGKALQEAALELKKVTETKKLDGWLGHSSRYQGAAEFMLGDVEQAIETINKGIAISEHTNEVLYKAVTLCSLAKAYAQLMFLEEGMNTIQEAIQTVELTGERIWEPELYRVQAMLFQKGENVAGAEESLIEAIRIAQQQEAKFWELRASIDLARLWHDQGKTKEAKQLLDGIYNWFTEGFETSDLMEAQALLAEL
jgi:predicted ATPase/DNA-binding SARP family transcriptional activator